MLAKGEVDLRMGNGAKVVAIAVGEVNLKLASGHTLVLDTCYYVPSIIKNIISISFLNKLGHNFLFKNNSCFIYKNDEIIENEILTNGLFILDVRSTIMNVELHSMLFTISPFMFWEDPKTFSKPILSLLVLARKQNSRIATCSTKEP